MDENQKFVEFCNNVLNIQLYLFNDYPIYFNDITGEIMQVQYTGQIFDTAWHALSKEEASLVCHALYFYMNKTSFEQE